MDVSAHSIVISIGTEPVIAARFRLLWDAAPHTCAAVAKALPFSGEVVHGTCSGEMAVLFLDEELRVAPENATTQPQVGELLFTHYDAGWRRGQPDPVSEIY